MLTLLQRIAEQKIERALADGNIPDLSHWKNKPLPEDDNMQHVPADLRIAYRMLKNGGYLPEEITLRKKIVCTEELLAKAENEKAKYKQLKKLKLLQLKLEMTYGKTLRLETESPYFNKLVGKIG